MGRKRKKTTALLATLDGAEAVIYALDRELSLVYANAACGHWLATDTADLIGRRCTYSAIVSDEETLPLAPPDSAWESDQPFIQAMPIGTEPLSVTFHPMRVEGVAKAMLAVGTPPTDPLRNGEVLTSTRLHEQLLKLRTELVDRSRIANLLGNSPAMQMVRQQAMIASGTTANVLLIGEPGSGRQSVARAIHRSGVGVKSSLAQIACPITGAEMLQAAVKAFLRRQAELGEDSPGTLLLTDVDQLPADAQHELAGFLALPEVRIRLIGTCRRMPTDLAKEGTFDRQLAYQLSTVTIALPSLRERREDIPLLAQHYLEQATHAADSIAEGFTPESLELLTTYDWPENLPQLAEAIRSTSQGAKETLLSPEALPDFLHRAEEATKRKSREWEPIKLDDFLEEIETELIQEAMQYAKGNKTKASKLLGISRARLIRRVQQLGFTPEIDFEEIE